MTRITLALLFVCCAAQADERALKSVTILAGEKSFSLEKALVSKDRLWVPAGVLPRINGYTYKPEGLCRKEICIPLPQAGSWLVKHEGLPYVDVLKIADKLGQAVAGAPAQNVWSFSAVPDQMTLARGQAPDFELPDRNGKMVKLSDHRGKKILLLTWASW